MPDKSRAAAVNDADNVYLKLAQIVTFVILKPPVNEYRTERLLRVPKRMLNDSRLTMFIFLVKYHLTVSNHMNAVISRFGLRE